MSFHSWLHNLRSALAPRRGQRQHGRSAKGGLRAATHRPNLEILEARCLLSFSPAVNYPIGAYAAGLVTADFNNDGRLDLATDPAPTRRDHSRAVSLAKEAVELKPQEGNYRNTLGAAQYRAGDSKAAIAALEESMKRRKGGDSGDWFFLAMAHWQLGEKDKAREWYERAVQWMDKIQPTNEELRRFRAEAAELLELKDKKSVR